MKNKRLGFSSHIRAISYNLRLFDILLADPIRENKASEVLYKYSLRFPMSPKSTFEL